MKRTVIRYLVVLVAAAFLLTPFRALAQLEDEFEDPQLNVGYMVGDTLIARPIGIVATVAGFGLFIIASPFALLGGNAGETWNNLVVYPAAFTFTRPLGDFD